MKPIILLTEEGEVPSKIGDFSTAQFPHRRVKCGTIYYSVSLPLLSQKVIALQKSYQKDYTESYRKAKREKIRAYDRERRRKISLSTLKEREAKKSEKRLRTIARTREKRLSPEGKRKARERYLRYISDPAVVEKIKKYHKDRYNTPEGKASMLKAMKKYLERKKAER